jgi:hypothetical protein
VQLFNDRLRCAGSLYQSCLGHFVEPLQAMRVIGDELAALGNSDGVGHVVRLIEVPAVE